MDLYTRTIRSHHLGNSHETSLDLIPNGQCDIALISDLSVKNSEWRTFLSEMDLEVFDSLERLDMGEFAGEDLSQKVETLWALLDKGIRPVVVGASPELIHEMHQSYERKMQPYNISWLKPSIDASELEPWRQSIVIKEINLICLQRHLVPHNALKSWTDLVELHYLSEYRKSSSSTEPLLRRSNMHIVNPACIRFSEFPAKGHQLVSGLYSEEMASLCKVSGSSEKAQILFIENWNTQHQNEDICDFNIAQMLWYFMEGALTRKIDEATSSNALTEYLVEATDLGREMIFCKSEKSGKWWFREPEISSEQNQMSRLLPCTYEEYLQTVHHQTPKRIVELFHQELL